MKTVLISLIGVLTLGAALPVLAGPDWQIIEQARKAKLERLQQAATPTSASSASSGSGEAGNSMSGMPMQKCEDMKGMDMKGCNDMMKSMDHQPAGRPAMRHAVGVVRAADPSKGTVTLAHGPVSSLNWPAMTMTFAVKDKSLFGKLAVDKKVDVDFVQQGKDYVVTGVQ